MLSASLNKKIPSFHWAGTVLLRQTVYFMLDVFLRACVIRKQIYKKETFLNIITESTPVKLVFMRQLWQMGFSFCQLRFAKRLSTTLIGFWSNISLRSDIMSNTQWQLARTPFLVFFCFLFICLFCCCFFLLTAEVPRKGHWFINQDRSWTDCAFSGVCTIEQCSICPG